jgi:hypothetical protein
VASCAFYLQPQLHDGMQHIWCAAVCPVVLALAQLLQRAAQMRSTMLKFQT